MSNTFDVKLNSCSNGMDSLTAKYLIEKLEVIFSPRLIRVVEGMLFTAKPGQDLRQKQHNDLKGKLG